jgi:hypothetical protein
MKEESEEKEMIQYEGMKAAESSKGSGNSQLPVGAYVGKVLGARVTGKEPDQRLEIMLDVAEGKFTDFYMDKFTAAKQRNSKYEVRYKGIISFRIPNPKNKNAQYPESDKERFNDLIYRFQESNDGFVFDGDESKLTDLLIGFSVQEDEYNGNRFTKPARLEIVQQVRDGLISPMRPRWERNGQDPTKAPMVDQRSGMQVVNTEALPWDKPY